MNRTLVILFSLFLFIEPVRAQHVPDTGEIAPNFVGTDQYGQRIELDSLLKEGPVVFFFYRGQWCPYCRKHLSEFQEELGMLEERGAIVVAIVPENTEYIEKGMEQTGTTFSVVYDSAYQIMKSYGVNFVLEERLVKRYNNVLDANLSEAHGTEEIQLPIPATFVVDQSGKIIYRHYDKDYKNRSSVSDILVVLDNR